MTSEARSAWLGWIHAATILVSAFLLFQVQPLISKFILPWFGGSPAVWTTCMVFFQSLLFCGYAYAHFSEHFFKPVLQGLVHLALIVAALFLLPITPDESWKPTDPNNPTWRILCLLGITVGLPYFVLSSTGPLVQAWFSRSYPGRSPYRLYALSNIGSLTALISYPFFFEPLLNAGSQAVYWSGGFVLFGLLCGYGAVRIWKAGSPAAATAMSASGESSADRAPPPWLHRAWWIALPAFASLMLLATTNHVCQNVAVIPFLWVVPLSLYLLTFIICFDHERWYVRRWFAAATALLTFIVAGLSDWDIDVHFVYELVLYFATMFGICMLCHGELVRLRPSPRYLTTFYLMISAGGALGGIFVSLVAPQVFNTFFEWQISLVAGYVLAVSLMALDLGWPSLLRRRWLAVPSAALGCAGLLAILHYQSGSGRVPVAESRNFYGEVAVVERAEDEPLNHDFAMFHGSIIHGVQFVHLTKRNHPTTYYSAKSGVGRTLDFYADRPDLRVGAIGLGVGTLAAYARPGQVYRFYEINPEVVLMAQEHFSFLKDCRGRKEIVLGDARLSMEQEPPQRYDVLVLDAFSGDAVPSHLLTRECFEIYLKHLADDGTIAVHITNTYLDLAPVVRALAEEFRFQRVRIETGIDPEWELYHAEWMLLSRNQELLAALAPFCLKQEAAETATQLWTDDHSNLVEILK